MTRWFVFSAEALNDYRIQKLSGWEFKKKFYQARNGVQNEFSKYMRPGRHRTDLEWVVRRKQVFERDDYTCQYCGERGKKLECDHVFPLSRGGSDEIENLATACFSCNRSKRDKTLEEWRGT